MRESIWEHGTVRKTYPALHREATADVAIIGAGITGLTAAVLLKRAGMNVVVLERDRVGGGTSGLTTAHVSTIWDHGYHDVSKKYGVETSALVARCMRDGLECIARLNRELSIDC